MRRARGDTQEYREMMWRIGLFVLSSVAVGFALGSDFMRATEANFVPLPSGPTFFMTAPACKDDCATTFSANSKSLIVIRQNDGIVRDGDGRDLAELEGVARTKFTKCGGQ